MKKKGRLFMGVLRKMNGTVHSTAIFALDDKKQNIGVWGKEENLNFNGREIWTVDLMGSYGPF